MPQDIPKSIDKRLNPIAPSRSVIYLHLLENGPRTKQEIVHETGLSRSTVRFSLRFLKENGLVIEKFNKNDARQSIFEPINQDAPVAAGFLETHIISA